MVKGLSWQQVAALLLATVLNLVTFAPPWMAALPGLGFLRAFALTQASTASTYIAPGGAAVGVGLSYAILRAWGFGTVRVPKLARSAHMSAIVRYGWSPRMM